MFCEEWFCISFEELLRFRIKQVVSPNFTSSNVERHLAKLSDMEVLECIDSKDHVITNDTTSGWLALFRRVL